MTVTEQKLVRWSLAIVWIVTGLLSLGIFPFEDSLDLLKQVGLTGKAAWAALLGGAVIDIVIGILTLLSPNQKLWLVQGVVILTYTLVITIRLPEFWLHPFGPILKNIPILTMLWWLYKASEGEQ